jgi:hypothetical protein
MIITSGIPMIAMRGQNNAIVRVKPTTSPAAAAGSSMSNMNEDPAMIIVATTRWIIKYVIILSVSPGAQVQFFWHISMENVKFPNIKIRLMLEAKRQTE